MSNISDTFLKRLADIRRMVPTIWKEIEWFYMNRNRGVLPDWPDWCFVPMAGFWEAVSDVSDDNEMLLVESLPFIAALGKWRYTMGVYEFDQDVYDELMSTPFSGKLPIEVLLRLPQWCMYIKTPDAGDVEGFFVHLEYDTAHKRKELRVVLYHGDGDGEEFGGTNLILHLEHDTLDECLNSVVAEGLDTLSKAGMNDLDLNEMGGSLGDVMSAEFTSLTKPLWKKVLPLILYFCTTPDEDAPPSQSVRYTNPKPKKVKGGVRLFPANGPKTHKVGRRDGDTIRDFNAMIREGGLSGRTVRPHIRRAHWHGYWKGPRDSDEREFIYKWLPPTVVSSRY